MVAFRVSKNKNYTTINNTGLRDERLTWKAKGILVYILSLPDDWVFYMEEIAKHSKDGIASLKAGMKELKECGYVKRFPIKGEDGKIHKWETIIYEVPQVEKPQVEILPMENLPVENELLLSTNIPSTNNTNSAQKKSLRKNVSESYSDEFEQLWKIYPKRIDKKQGYKSFKAANKKHSFEIILFGVKGYGDYIKRNGTETKFVKHASTFFNNECYLEYVEQPKPPVQNEPRVATNFSIDNLLD
ncbi:MULTISPECIES: helix-turn-helix domain-containing protein [unclassified Bacillus (in: firmicutes)]|uniref:helix-turn-helix domain-containing protein n=1 Tax=unclassified Bacillus (in: firmicutes) TaxID=185979 RepID=UPI0008F0EB83|nr:MULTISPECIES: helix-turn-helix domain-containing protein [unclassified Bacillus (in: firmicutes)]SFK05280.1 hypothetical protein SAMN04488574_14720 [Bacillus sp. 71mf]SFT22593.1 hypothetical protein SAMN04488145_12510 [Bacillus sp. 103mf]